MSFTSRTYRLSPRLAVAALALALLPIPATACASYDPLGSATATISLDKGFSSLLAAHGVTVSATAPAKRTGSSFTLPLGAGEVDPTSLRIAIEQQGSLSFSHGPRRVILRHISVKTSSTPLIAKVGGGQLKIATSAERSFARKGFGSSFTARGLRLTKKAAVRLDKKLRLHGVFEQGQVLGAVRVSAQPETTAILPTGRFTLAPVPAFLAKLESLFVSANPIAPTELAPGPLFTLPLIPAGTIAPDASSGVPRSGGSIEFLQLGAGQVFWHELWLDLANHQVIAEVDIEPTPTFPGKLGQVPVMALDLSSATISSDPKSRTVSVAGAGLALNAQSAAAFNEAFAKPQGKADVFQAGEVLGSISLTVRTH